MIDVLVVDDDFMVASIHADFVARIPGFRVVGTAHSGKEALDSVARLRPQIVLLDIYLPDMNGMTVLQHLREERHDVDVLVITADRDAETVKKALRGGVLNYILKPFDESTLRERLLNYARVVHEGLSASTTSSQDELDRMFGVRPSPAGRAPKSITVETVKIVEEILRRTTQGISASECAEASGLSRVSARRYLEYLANKGLATTTLRYATAGRPERKYHWALHDGGHSQIERVEEEP
jgi:response regulator of citrate/malate metabolism